MQDVELQSNCCLTCFGLKAVNVQTAGQSGTVAPEVSAAFLANPEKVREAIQLAVKLYRQQGDRGRGGYGGPRTGPMTAWGESVPTGPKLFGMMQRLQDLEALTQRGVLSHAEANELKVGCKNHCCHAHDRFADVSIAPAAGSLQHTEARLW